MKNHIIFLILFALIPLVILPAHAYEISYDYNGTKLDENPIICTIQPDDPELTEKEIERMMDQAKYAISEWENKLKKIDHKNKDLWEMEYVEISDKTLESISNCDVTINFEEKPQNEDWHFIFLGIAEPRGNGTQTDITIWYGMVGLSYESYREDDTIFYWYEPYYTGEVAMDALLRDIISHEFGHALGLGHYESDDRELNNQWAEGSVPAPSIMAPIMHQNPGDSQIRPIDIEKLAELYGKDGFLGKEDEEKILSKYQAEKLLEDEEYKKLVKYAEEFEDSEVNKNVSYYKGLGLYHLEEYDLAIESFSKSVEINPINKDVWYYLARSLFEIKNYEEALESINEAIELDPEELRNIQRKGLILFHLEEYKESIREYNKALELDKDSATTLSRMGDSYWELGDFKRASTHYDLALEADEENVRALHGKAKAIHKFEGPEEGLKHYNIVLKEDPSHFKSLEAKYRILLELDKELEASSILATLQDHDDYNDSQLAKENPTIDERPSSPTKEEVLTIPTKKNSPEIPQWIKSNADWWASGSIDDQTFVGGIQFLIEQKIIEIDSVGQKTDTPSEIPQWIKSNADWWSKGLISDEDFLKGIKFLVENSIISVK